MFTIWVFIDPAQSLDKFHPLQLLYLLQPCLSGDSNLLIRLLKCIVCGTALNYGWGTVAGPKQDCKITGTGHFHHIMLVLYQMHRLPVCFQFCALFWFYHLGTRLPEGLPFIYTSLILQILFWSCIPCVPIKENEPDGCLEEGLLTSTPQLPLFVGFWWHVEDLFIYLPSLLKNILHFWKSYISRYNLSC